MSQAQAVRIYGAGMAGLLAAGMLRRYAPTLHEQQPSLPDNHGALLRFRSRAVEQETGQHFRCVSVIKAVKSGGVVCNTSTLRDANMYSYKVSKQFNARSVLNLSPGERFIAPPDFLSVMARDAPAIKFSDGLTMERIEEHRAAGESIVSTIPMPVLMKIVGWPVPEFKWLPVWSVIAKISTPADVYQTIYYPGVEPYYRASITGDDLIVEFAQEPDGGAENLYSVLSDFGLLNAEWSFVKIKRQEYGKLIPLGADDIQRFIIQMTDEYRLYSVGRFATWRQILLDDVVNDIKIVSRWISQRSDYARRKEL